MHGLTREQFDGLNALKCGVAYNRYGAYCVPASSVHRPAAATIMNGHVYEPDTIEFLRANCGAGDIVHAGTYFGDFLPAISAACQGKVWAFEPNHENFRCARVTLLLNDLANVSLTRAALGARSENRRLLTVDPDGLPRGGASTLLSDEAPSSGQVEVVPVVCIDDAVPPDRPVSIIQLDVEGHEAEALAGALRTIERCRPVIVVEVLAGSGLLASPWFHENILALGYRMTGTIHGNAVLLPEG